MYTQEFWDEVYRHHNGDAPWLTDIWAKAMIDEFAKYIDAKQPKKILDYGCGNGKIGMYFLKQQHNVEFAEISHEMVKELNAVVNNQVPIYLVEYPREITQKYDYIIASGVFHHLNPEVWPEFLEQFYYLLNPGGKLLISGANKDDAILLDNHNNAPMTNHFCWEISSLPTMIDNSKWQTNADYNVKVKLDAFDQYRTMRILVLAKL